METINSKSTFNVSTTVITTDPKTKEKAKDKKKDLTNDGANCDWQELNLVIKKHLDQLIESWSIHPETQQKVINLAASIYGSLDIGNSNWSNANVMYAYIAVFMEGYNVQCQAANALTATANNLNSTTDNVNSMLSFLAELQTWYNNGINKYAELHASDTNKITATIPSLSYSDFAGLVKSDPAMFSSANGNEVAYFNSTLHPEDSGYVPVLTGITDPYILSFFKDSTNADGSVKITTYGLNSLMTDLSGKLAVALPTSNTSSNYATTYNGQAFNSSLILTVTNGTTTELKSLNSQASTIPNQTEVIQNAEQQLLQMFKQMCDAYSGQVNKM